MSADKLKVLQKKLSSKKKFLKEATEFKELAKKASKLAEAHKFMNLISSTAEEIEGLEAQIEILASPKIKTSAELLEDALLEKAMASAKASFIAVTAISRDIAELSEKVKAESIAEAPVLEIDEQLAQFIDIINSLPDVTKAAIIAAIK